MPFYFPIPLIIFWCLIWYIYNRYLKERKISDSGQILIALFFAFSVSVVFHFYQDILPRLDPRLICVVAAMFILDLILKNVHWMFKFIVRFKSKNTLYLTSTIFNILFQQSVINVMVFYFHTMFSTGLTVVVFTLLFGILHSPLLFMKHVADREIDVIGSFILGFLSSYLILNFSLGYIYVYIIHYLFYIVYSMRIKDESLI
jgi:hypothetical protein